MIYHVHDVDRRYYAWKVCRWLYGGAWKWGLWFRLFGRGLHIARGRIVLFAERYGYRKVYRLGRWSFEWLERPTDIVESGSGK